MSVTEEQSETKSGLSRRDLIKKGAVAGAVFWSVPVIESITSRAAAASGALILNCSWVYIVYSKTVAGLTTYYATGFAGGGGAPTCTEASYPESKPSVSFPCSDATGSHTYELAGAHSAPPNITVDGNPVTFLELSTAGCNYFTWSTSGGQASVVMNSTGTALGFQTNAAFYFGTNLGLRGTCWSSGSNTFPASC